MAAALLTLNKVLDNDGITPNRLCQAGGKPYGGFSFLSSGSLLSFSPVDADSCLQLMRTIAFLLRFGKVIRQNLNVTVW